MLTLSDLWDVDAGLARGLQQLLEFPEGMGLIEDIFGVTFTASINPLVARSYSQKTIEYINLIENGSNIMVTRSNRQQFVELFIQYSLYHCCIEAIVDYCSGLQFFLNQFSY